MIKEKTLTPKEIKHYKNIWNYTTKELQQFGRKKLKQAEIERWSFVHDYEESSANTTDCTGCWMPKERCTCNGSPNIMTNGDKTMLEAKMKGIKPVDVNQWKRSINNLNNRIR